MQEPVHISGVVAFPNPNGNRDIRFIDASYNTLFTIPDGGSIVITGRDGTKTTKACAYIDDYHTRIGCMTFHICEFAETMERIGSVYAPA